MKEKRGKILLVVLIISLGLFLLTGCSNDTNNVEIPNEVPPVTQMSDSGVLRILATSDMHDYLMNYDYYTCTESNDYGLVKLATIIKDFKSRSEVNNVVLIDNGDLIQGNPLGDYFARINPVSAGEEHPIYQALGALDYDAAGLGNHEFNYGLEFLNQIIQDSSVPIINANVYNAATEQNEFRPYVIVNKTIKDEMGDETEVKVGIISFVPTQILNWDKLNLEGKVTVQDIKACAEYFIPMMKQEGADLIVALAHTGYGSDGDYVEGAENMAYYLTLMENIDVVVGGHSHDTFPAENFVESTGYQRVDLEKGTINDTFTVQPAKYAEGIGVVTLQLQKSDTGYEIIDGTAVVMSAKDVVNDPEIEALLKPYHEEVINYVNSPVGELTAPLDTFFALAMDNACVQIISDAQLDYAKRAMEDAEELAPYKDLPILSAAAPFKAGLSKDGTKPDDYVVIPQGSIAIKDVASLYKYPNTVSILKLRGADIREWLEMSAGMYNTILEGGEGNQDLYNVNYPAFNFDTIDGVTYEIDITQPARYDVNGNLINADTHRIRNLQFNNVNLVDEDEFLVVTNNYRAGGGGNFPIFTGDTTPVVYSSSDETRQVVADYIAAKGIITPHVDRNWRLKPVNNETNLLIISSTDAVKTVGNHTFLVKNKDLGNGLMEFIYKLNIKKE